MENFSINNEIVNAIEIQQQKLEIEFEKLKCYTEQMKEKIKQNSFSDMKEAERSVQWLKEMTMFTSLLQEYYTNYPNIKHQKEYISDKFENVENVTEISDKVYNIIMPLGMLLTTVMSIQQN